MKLRKNSGKFYGIIFILQQLCGSQQTLDYAGKSVFSAFY